MRSFKSALEYSKINPIIVIEDAQFLFESLSDMERSSFFSMLIDFARGGMAMIFMSAEDTYYAHQINGCKYVKQV